MGTINVLLVFLMIVFSHMHFDFAACSISRCREIERKALMDFKGSLVDKHNLLSSWTGRDCCSWYGIMCHNHTGFVQEIDLNNYKYSYFDALGVLHIVGLGGQINSSLLNLEHLEILDLSYNNFAEIQIPAFLGSLRNLQVLNLLDANFSGEIPQHLGNLSNLQYLSLGHSIHPVESPPYLSSRSQPPRLISESLKWITRLSSLTSLELSDVSISESVDWLDSVNTLSFLSSFRLTGCGLVSMALSHDLNLTSLVHLDLSYNNFNSPLNPSFFNLSSLEHVTIIRSLSSPIPNMFQKLTALNSLFLSENLFGSTFPDSLCTLTSLTYLVLENSSLHGSLPSCIGNLTNLTFFLLNDNEFSGTIPQTLGNLTGLKELDVSRNSLTVELSESFFYRLKNLEYLASFGNKFVALNVTSQWIPPLRIQTLKMHSVFMGFRPSLPVWLQSLTNLGVLLFENSDISGVIPAWCQTSYPHLEYLDLSHNFLVGTIPTFNVINKATLRDLDLSNNQFTGKIPDEICNLHSMTSLNLASNKLTGRIPSCLGNLRELLVLDLANNSLSGHIPYEIGYLSHLVLLQLNGNKLFGELPSSLQNLTELITLDLGKNKLQGFIPNWIGKEFHFLEHLMIQSNKFSGEISPYLCQLSSLWILNLAENNLVGTIPPCLGNLSTLRSNDSGDALFSNLFVIIIIKGYELEYSTTKGFPKFISLSGNHLHGKIPDELMDLTGLQSLNMSNNHLTGNIPERIGNMKHLESLDLSMNHLSGIIPQTLVGIDGLGYLNLSFNDLSGMIPSGGHLDTFSNLSVYEGNGELCGKPTMKSCDDDLVPSKQKGLVSNGDDDSEVEFEWFYAGVGPGFAFGFVGVFCILFFKSSWRYRFFRFLEILYSRF